MTVSINAQYSHNYKNGALVLEALSAANETVARGHYAATTLSTVDAELATVNIKNGITIFGFAGDADVHDISDATAIEAEVIAGETFYAASGGIRTGTMPIVALDPDANAYPTGYHAGAANLTTVDAQLVTGSIKFGITIFGVAGHTNIRDVSDANALVGEVKTGRTFFAVGGAIKTGTMDTVALAPGSSAYPAGYHAGNVGGLVAIDGDFVAANIANGVVIFGVTGTLPAGGVETFEKFSCAELASSATYTPDEEGIFFVAQYPSPSYQAQVYSTSEGWWYNVGAQAVYAHKGFTVVGDGTNMRIYNNNAGQAEYIMFRHHLSTGTYERYYDAELATNASYAIADEGYYSLGMEGGSVGRLQVDFDTHGWDDAEEGEDNSYCQTVAIGDGTNYRIKNGGGGPFTFVLMRAVMT